MVHVFGQVIIWQEKDNYENQVNQTQIYISRCPTHPVLSHNLSTLKTYLFDGVWDQVARRVPHGTVGDARPLGLQVEHVVPGFHVLGAEM